MLSWENLAWSCLEALALTVIVLAGIVGVLAVSALLS
jgi:hypothetical protein